MENRTQDSRYEQLYTEMLAYTRCLHERNRSRIRHGTIALLALPFILCAIRWLTDSDKVMFLLIWVMCVVALAAYLIGVEYLDHSIQKKLADMTDREASFSSLLEAGHHGPGIAGHLKERMDDLYESRVEQLKQTGVLPDRQPAQPEAADAGAARPVQAQPEAAQPEAADAGAARPEPAQPEAAQPEAADAGAAQQPAQPEAAQPEDGEGGGR